MIKSPLIIFCGKGGVGKTTLSLAFGLLNARRGTRVLVVTSHPLRELAVSVSLDGLTQKTPQAADNLFVVHIDPRQVLALTVEEQFPSRMLARMILSSRIYESLIEVAPGLKEIAFLSRLRELAEHRAPEVDYPSYQLVIWDAPATGHFLNTMVASKNFDRYLTGPFASKGKELNDFFSERTHFTLFPITTLEEMAVQETIELCHKLKEELEISPKNLICNLVSPFLAASRETFQNMQQQLRPQTEHSGWEFVLGRHRLERELFEGLRSSLQSRFHLIRRTSRWQGDLDLLMGLADQMEGLGPEAA